MVGSTSVSEHGGATQDPSLQRSIAARSPGRQVGPDLVLTRFSESLGPLVCGRLGVWQKIDSLEPHSLPSLTSPQPMCPWSHDFKGLSSELVNAAWPI